MIQRKSLEERTPERAVRAHHNREHPGAKGNDVRSLPTLDRQMLQARHQHIARALRVTQIQRVVEVGEGRVLLQFRASVCGQRVFGVDREPMGTARGAEIKTERRMRGAEETREVQHTGPGGMPERTARLFPASKRARERRRAPCSAQGAMLPNGHSDTERELAARPDIRSDERTKFLRVAARSVGQLGSRCQRRLNRRGGGRQHEAQLPHAEAQQPSLVAVVYGCRRQHQRRRHDQPRQQRGHRHPATVATAGREPDELAEDTAASAAPGPPATS